MAHLTNAMKCCCFPNFHPKKDQKNSQGTNIAKIFLKPLPVNGYRRAKKGFVLYFTSMCIYYCKTKGIISLIRGLMFFVALILAT